MANDTDILGERGEAIVIARLTEFHRGRPLFRPSFLGAKWPSVDCIVELIGAEPRAYFFIQVKTTRQGYTSRGPRRLRAGISKPKLVQLARYRAPTYVIAVDDKDEKAFLISTVGAHLKGASSVSCEFEVDKAVREALWDEVVTFWAKVRTRPRSGFVEPRWK